MEPRLVVLLEAEATYLREAGWVNTMQSNATRRNTIWKSPHDGDEYAQSSALMKQKIEDGYLPRPVHVDVGALGPSY